MHYQSPEESRQAKITYHLVPAAVWQACGTSAEYVPEAFETDGFIHCTNGLSTLVDVANMFYRGDEREYDVLVLDVDRIYSNVRFDDPEKAFPHIYGSLNTSAVTGRLVAERDSDGAFLRFVAASASLD